MKRTFYLFSSGRLERKDNTLKFTPIKDDEGGEQELPPRYLPVEDIAEIYAFGSLRTNSSLFNFLGQKDIPVHYYDYYENYTGSFMPRDGLLAGRVLLAQAKTYENKKRRTELARKFIQGAAWNMVQNLNYYNRRGKELTDPVTQMKQLADALEHTKSVEEVMGIEGNIRKTYYACFDTIIDNFSMGERTKQPPQNEVNALISFGNMMCYTETLRAIHQTQLNPTISFLHTPGERGTLCLSISLRSSSPYSWTALSSRHSTSTFSQNSASTSNSTDVCSTTKERNSLSKPWKTDMTRRFVIELSAGMSAIAI